MRLWLTLAAGALLAACTLTPQQPASISAWPLRLQQLQAADHWNLQGRAAGAVGTQGWQASLDWRQAGTQADVRLAGPLGAGAVAVKLSPAGMTLDPPPRTDPDAFLSERLGFTPPFEQLRYWLLGVPSPTQAFELTSNPQGRAALITQDGWSIEYGEYMRAGADVLPKRIVLRREAVRVRVAVDRWTLSP